MINLEFCLILEMADEIFRLALADMVNQNPSMPDDHRKALLSEISKMDLTVQAARDQLKQILGVDAIDNAWRNAQAKAALPTENRNERQIPKAICLGGDVAILAGVDLDREKQLLSAILRRANKRTVTPLISVMEISNFFPSLTPPAAEAAVHATAAVIARIISAASSLKSDRQRAQVRMGDLEISSLRNHPSLAPGNNNLRLLGVRDFINASEIQGGSLLLPWLRDRFDTRLLTAAQAKIFS